MTELNVLELREELVKQNKQLTGASEILQELRDKQSMTNNEISSCESEIRIINRQRTRLQELLIIAGIVIPEELKRQRNEILAKRERVQREDITIAEQRTLTQEIAQLAKGLPDHCQHLLVLGYDGFAGFPPEYENQYNGRRVCAVCGCEEQSSSTSDDVYKMLVEKEGCIIKRDWHACGRWDSKRRDVWVLFDEIREAFIAAADKGEMNIEWSTGPR